MYWRDIDTIAPRRPVRVRRNNGMRPSGTVNRKISAPDVGIPVVVQRPLVEKKPVSFQDQVVSSKNGTTSSNGPDWKETALRLQADMDNFRKRQQQRADEAISGEKERLLTLFLPVVDNLTRALAHQNGTDQDETHFDEGTEASVWQGVELTHRELMRVLESEGVTPLEVIGQPFDPEWQEAVATIPAEVESGKVVEQVEAGYKLGDKLLRPAKVVVAA